MARIEGVFSGVLTVMSLSAGKRCSRFEFVVSRYPVLSIRAITRSWSREYGVPMYFMAIRSPISQPASPSSHSTTRPRMMIGW